MIYMDFISFSNSQLLLKIHFCTGVLRKIQNLTNTPLVHGKHPRTNCRLAIRALAMGGGGTGQIRRTDRAPGRGNGGARPWAHLGPVGDRCWGVDRAVVGARRKPAVAAAVTRLWQRRGLGPNNKWHLRVLKGLWMGCARSLDRGKQGGVRLDGGGVDGPAAGKWRRGNGGGGRGERRSGFIGEAPGYATMTMRMPP
jgi:hypothetical protein